MVKKKFKNNTQLLAVQSDYFIEMYAHYFRKTFKYSATMNPWTDLFFNGKGVYLIHTNPLWKTNSQRCYSWIKFQMTSILVWLLNAKQSLTSQVVNLIRDLDTDFSILGKNYVNIIQVSTHLIAMSSSCYNPFIYASLHNKFLSYLCRHLLPQRRSKGKDRGQGSSILTMSHRVLRLHTSTEIPEASAHNVIPQDNYA